MIALGTNPDSVGYVDGSNQSGFESPGQLRHDVRFSLLFFIWGVGMEQANYNWTAQEAAFERQCQAVKAMSPQRPCLVYLDWGTSLGWYTAQAEAASDPSLEDIWLRDESGHRLPGPGHPGLSVLRGTQVQGVLERRPLRGVL